MQYQSNLKYFEYTQQILLFRAMGDTSARTWL
nr:MAG TPA: hypothetical protein [Caudoviricetes sp.]